MAMGVQPPIPLDNTSFPPLQLGLKRLQNSCISAIRRGIVPQYIAIIMDGNRGYARSHTIDMSKGHIYGIEVLKKILEACLRVGVKVVTVYTFSIQNFRSKYEVDVIMDLGKSHLFNSICHS
jgi:ditrans,polycis-polyprenyl diphosphate synthase